MNWNLIGVAFTAFVSIILVAGPVVACVWVVLKAISNYTKARTAHEVEVMQQAASSTVAIELPSGDVFIRRWQGGGIVTEVVKKNQTQTTAQAATVDEDAKKAARLLVYSMTVECTNESHKHGHDGNQLLTQDECISVGVFGRPEDHKIAVDWLRKNWLIQDRAANGNKGVFTDKKLSELIDVLTALPQRGSR